MTDLEQDLRDALHARADAVTAADLRHADAPRARRPRTRYYAPLAAAAAVVVVAGAVAVATHSSPDRRDTVSAQGSSALAGTRWRLVAVQYTSHRVAIPAKLGAFVEFGRDGQFSAADGINSYSGSYTNTATGIRLGDIAGTAVGYAGHDPQVLAAMTGIGAFHGSVLTDVDANSLTITTRGPSPILTRSGTADIDPGFSGASGPPSGAGLSSSGPAPSGTASPTSTGAPPSTTQSYVNGSELPASSGPS